MRIWSIHPEYLDRQGLIALWREALLAKKVLAGETRGYRNHPQLCRFRASPDPVRAMESYLASVFEEAVRREYSFDRSKFTPVQQEVQATFLPVTSGQLAYERAWLLKKLLRRAPDRYEHLVTLPVFRPHPLFVVVPGPIASWEKIKIPFH